MQPQVLTCLLLKTMLWQEDTKTQHTPNIFLGMSQASTILIDFIDDEENLAKQHFKIGSKKA